MGTLARLKGHDVIVEVEEVYKTTFSGHVIDSNFVAYPLNYYGVQFLKKDWDFISDGIAVHNGILAEKQKDALNSLKTLKKDKIVESVINQFRQRSEVGIKKYGTTLEENNHDDFIQHLFEELMDAILYLEKIKSMRNGN